MADESFYAHQYLPGGFRLGEPAETGVIVSRSSRRETVVGLSFGIGAFRWFDYITTEQAVTLARALLDAASDAEKALPVTESMGATQLMVRRATGGLFDVAKGGAP